MKAEDRVVCVDSSPAQGVESGLIEGKTYTVTDIFSCSCGEIGVQVGVIEDRFMNIICHCGNKYPYPKERCYSVRRFVPIEFSDYAEEQIHEALKGVKELHN